MSVIIKKDNGTEFVFTVCDDNGIVDLSAVTGVVATFVRSDRTKFQKTLTIDDALAGKCYTVLKAEDLNVAGTYTMQVTVSFDGGGVFSSNRQIFTVGDKL